MTEQDDATDQDHADRALMRYEAMAFKWVSDHGIDKAIDAVASNAGETASKCASAIHGLVTQAWVEGADSGFQARKALHEQTKQELSVLRDASEAPSGCSHLYLLVKQVEVCASALQRAWDAQDSLPPIDFTFKEASALVLAIASTLPVRETGDAS